MSKSQLSAFQKLTGTLERLDKLSSQLPEQMSGLANQLRLWYQETEVTRREMLAESRALSELAGSGGQRIAQADDQVMQSFTRCEQAFNWSAQETANIIREGPNTEVNALSEIMFKGLEEQREQLSTLSQIEADSDLKRIETLAHHSEQLRQASEWSENILAALTRSDSSISAAIRTEHRLVSEGDARQGVSLNQQSIQAYYQGLPQTARALLEQAVVLAPNEVAIWLNLARVSLEAKRVEQATQALRTASSLAPDLLEVHHAEAMLALQRGENKRAIEILERCVDTAANPTEEVAFRLNLAEAHYTSGHPQPAIEQWRRVLQIEPMHPVACSWLQMVA